MKITRYLKDNLFLIFIYIMSVVCTSLLLVLLKTNIVFLILIIMLQIITGLFVVLYNYFKKYNFYKELVNNVNFLDKKYLVTETISKPNFYEGMLIYDSLYEINKSMLENVNEYEKSVNDFKEYIEMWIHEVKIPISSLVLMCHNEKNAKYTNQIKKLDNYIDQVLYYVRSENFEKDFMIGPVKLDKVISNVAIKNKDEILENDIDFNVDVKNIKVLTDYKWLEFIINQIINNSIKYKKDKESYIKISAVEDSKKVILSIMDNGIGIPKEDLSRVFNKSFTGSNGRIKSKSTGMGLYIAKKLCDKLGHKITIDSEKNKFTKIDIIFMKNKFYKIED